VEKSLSVVAWTSFSSRQFTAAAARVDCIIKSTILCVYKLIWGSLDLFLSGYVAHLVHKILLVSFDLLDLLASYKLHPQKNLAVGRLVLTLEVFLISLVLKISAMKYPKSTYLSLPAFSWLVYWIFSITGGIRAFNLSKVYVWYYFFHLGRVQAYSLTVIVILRFKFRRKLKMFPLEEGYTLLLRKLGFLKIFLLTCNYTNYTGLDWGIFSVVKFYTTKK